MIMEFLMTTSEQRHRQAVKDFKKMDFYKVLVVNQGSYIKGFQVLTGNDLQEVLQTLKSKIDYVWSDVFIYDKRPPGRPGVIHGTFEAARYGMLRAFTNVKDITTCDPSKD